MEIYIVIGSSTSYKETRFWTVSCFKDKNDAENLKCNLNYAQQLIINELGGRYTSDNDKYEFIKRKIGQLDKSYIYNHGDILSVTYKVLISELI